MTENNQIPLRSQQGHGQECEVEDGQNKAAYQRSLWAKHLQEVADELPGLLLPLLDEVDALLLNLLDKLFALLLHVTHLLLHLVHALLQVVLLLLVRFCREAQRSDTQAQVTESLSPPSGPRRNYIR